jgi:hypothetical protein
MTVMTRLPVAPILSIAPTIDQAIDQAGATGRVESRDRVTNKM